MQKVFGILVLIVIGAIIADFLLHPTGTGIVINGVSGIWRSGLQAAGGQQVT
jgi:hypothetical protein